MNRVVNIYKPIGKSPVAVINAFKKQYPEFKDETISPAGKLDPLAHGVMVLLIGDENKKRRMYEKSDKVYEFDVILGIKTDSYDVLGIPKIVPTLENIEEVVADLKGKQMQKFPPFSAYKVKGKPLFYWAREDKLDQIEIPEKEIEVYDIKLLSERTVGFKNLKEEIFKQIDSLNGDFRQEEIKAKWEDMNIDEVKILKIEAHVSTGTYIRGLANDLNGTAMNIYRAKAGTYNVSESIKIH